MYEAAEVAELLNAFVRTVRSDSGLGEGDVLGLFNRVQDFTHNLGERIEDEWNR